MKALPIRRRSIFLGVLAAFLVLAADQASKVWLLSTFDLPARPPVEFGPFLKLVAWWNRGISFGLFAGREEYRSWLLIGVAAGILLVLCIWLARAASTIVSVAVGLVIGGAVGNLIDRLRFGAVFDFIYVHIGAYYWPAFNVADSAICVGVVFLCIDALKNRSTKPPTGEGV